jgi:hypothetical protein
MNSDSESRSRSSGVNVRWPFGTACRPRGPTLSPVLTRGGEGGGGAGVSDAGHVTGTGSAQFAGCGRCGRCVRYEADGGLSPIRGPLLQTSEAAGARLPRQGRRAITVTVQAAGSGAGCQCTRGPYIIVLDLKLSLPRHAPGRGAKARRFWC